MNTESRLEHAFHRISDGAKLGSAGQQKIPKSSEDEILGLDPSSVDTHKKVVSSDEIFEQSFRNIFGGSGPRNASSELGVRVLEAASGEAYDQGDPQEPLSSGVAQLLDEIC